MAQVLNRSASPYKESCFVQAIYADGTVLRGSGTVVGANDVLTALHVIYNADHGGWATQVIVTPGAIISGSTFSAPLGTYSAASWTGYSSNWDTNNDGTPSLAESGHDLALLNFDLNLANLTGSLAVTDAQQNFNGTIVGYPVRGNGLMQEQVNATYLSNESVFRVDGALGVGASGGALVDSSQGNPTVSGVLSAGDSAYTYAIYAAMTGANLQWYQTAAAANDALLDASSTYRPMGAGISSGSDQDDRLIQTRLAYDSSNSSSVYGYKGADSLIMRGAYADYSLTARGGGLQVLDHYNGAHLSLYDVNALVFQDRTVYVVSEEQAQIARLYSALGRTPDLDGLQNWLNAHAHGMSFQNILSSFAQSAEFTAHYGDTSNSQFVSLLYGTVLDRAEDSTGAAHWIAQLEAGLSRQEAMRFFTDSLENSQRSEGDSGYLQVVTHSAWSAYEVSIQPNLVLGTALSDQLYEADLFQTGKDAVQVFGYGGLDVLHLSGPAGSYARTSGLPGGSSFTLTSTTTTAAISVHDVEVLSFTDHNVYALTDDQAQVARLYTAFDRTPDMEGLHGWLGLAHQGESLATIAQGVMQSAEFATRYGSLTNTDFVNALYLTVLHREAEATGAAHWVDSLERGATRLDTLMAVTNSVENQNLTQGDGGFIQLVGNSSWA